MVYSKQELESAMGNGWSNGSAHQALLCVMIVIPQVCL
jgi:hypothetical protein